MISLMGPFVGKVALSPIVSSSSFVFTVALAVTCFAAIRLRKTDPELERPYRAATVALYLGSLVAVTLIALMLLPFSPGRLGNVELMVIVLWLVLGVTAFIWRQRMNPMDKKDRDYRVLGEYA